MKNIKILFTILILIITHNKLIGQQTSNSFDDASLFFTAVKYQNIEGIKYLLNKGINVDIRGQNGATPLIYAAGHGDGSSMHRKIIFLLIKHGANVNAKDNDGTTPMIAASTSGFQYIVLTLFCYKADIYSKANDGWTALMIAAAEGHDGVVDEIVNRLKKRSLTDGAFINAQEYRQGLTALMLAAKTGHFYIVKKLVKKGALVNIKNKLGVTAVTLAQLDGYEEIAEYLLKQEILNHPEFRWFPQKDLTYSEIHSNVLKYNFYCASYFNFGFKNLNGKGFENNFEIIENGNIVIDKASNLMWQRYGSMLQIEGRGWILSDSFQNGAPYWQVKQKPFSSYAEAEKYISKLNEAKFGGFKDWRLPTIDEAMTLMEPVKNINDFHIDNIFCSFKSLYGGRDFNGNPIWTADKAKRNDYGANEYSYWTVDYGRGIYSNACKYGYVLAVRSMKY